MTFYDLINNETIKSLNADFEYNYHCENLRQYRYMFKRYTNAIDEICEELDIKSFYDNEIKLKEMIGRFAKERENLANQKMTIFSKNKLENQIKTLEKKENFAKIALKYSIWQDEALKNIRSEIIEIRNIEIKIVEDILMKNINLPIVQDVIDNIKRQNLFGEFLLTYDEFKKNNFVNIAIKILKDYCLNNETGKKYDKSNYNEVINFDSQGDSQLEENMEI